MSFTYCPFKGYLNCAQASPGSQFICVCNFFVWATLRMCNINLPQKCKRSISNKNANENAKKQPSKPLTHAIN